MANADLTAQRLRELLDYNPETGVFTSRVRRWKWPAGQVVKGAQSNGYICIGIDYGRHFAHRLAWLHFYGEWPAGMLDHINGDKTDNRIRNLRPASPAINSQNQRVARSDNKSCGLLGVTWHAPTYQWRAKLKIGKRYIHVGLFDTREAAHLAYVEAKRIHHAGCTL